MKFQVNKKNKFMVILDCYFSINVMKYVDIHELTDMPIFTSFSLDFNDIKQHIPCIEILMRINTKDVGFQ